MLKAKKEYFLKNFFPSFIAEWNKTDINIHNTESFMYI